MRSVRKLALAMLVVALAAGAGVALATPSGAQTAAGDGVRRALLIGVGDYKFDDVEASRRRGKGTFPRDLSGAVNDVRLMQEVLAKRFAFEPDNIATLTDKQATRAAMLAALEKIVADAGPQDVVYIHFSGHGSWIDDSNGDEPDGFDETIMPYDARTDDVPDITDDELNAVLAKLQARDALITLDSCHSGTATRGGSDVVSRGGAPDPALHLYQRADAAQARGQQLGRSALVDASHSVLPQTERYVLMTGAAAEHSALDSPIDSEEAYGWFTWSLAHTLSSLDQDTPVGEVFVRIQERMFNVGEMKGNRAPMPQLEATDGARSRPLLAGGDLTAGAARVASRIWVTADPGEAGQVLLRRGPLFGAAENSLWAIYPPDTVDFTNTPQFGTAVVKSRQRDDSVAALEVTGQVQPGSRAVLVAPSWQDTRVRVFLDKVTDADKDTFQAAVRTREGGENVLFVDETQPSRFEVDIEQGQCRIFSAGKLQEIESYACEDVAVGARRATEIFNRGRTVADLQALSNPSSKIRLTLDIQPLDARGQPSLRQIEGAQPLPLFKVWNGRERTLLDHLFLDISSSRSVYITIVQIGPTGDVDVLFPLSYDGLPDFYPDGLIPANEKVRIPDSLTPRAGFLYHMQEPIGHFTIRVFGASDIETARHIRAFIGEYAVAQRRLSSDVLYRSIYGDTASRGDGGVTERGAGVSVITASGTGDRGAGVSIMQRDEPPDWTATSASFVLER